MKDNNQNNNNNSQPVVLGVLKKEKSSKPFLAIIIFALLLGTCFGLPYIKEYLNTENNSITEFYQKYIKQYFEKDSDPNDINNNENNTPITNKYTCSIETKESYQEKIEYTYTFTDNNLTQINETKVFTINTNQNINDQIKTSYQTLSDQIKNLPNTTTTMNETSTTIELINTIDLTKTDITSLNNENYFNNQSSYEAIKTTLTNKGYTCS